MVTLNDYLYSGDTVPRILHNFIKDLKNNAIENKNQLDMAHTNLLLQMKDILEHNDFLTQQSQRMREFYKYMADTYPDLAFLFKGRIKSLIRTESKFNGYVVQIIYDYYKKNQRFPDDFEIKKRLNCFRDMIAYRIVLSLPKCHLKMGDNRTEKEIDFLYSIANVLPDFLEMRGFTPEISGFYNMNCDKRLSENVSQYYRDYVANPSPESGYQSLHITFYDNIARCFFEVQLRTKDMDDFAEIGPAHHLGYEKRQDTERIRRDEIPEGECLFFDEAYERLMLLHSLDLSKLDVNMFSAVNNSLINDGCGLYRGRLILPFEHLSRFQIDT